MNKPVIVGLAGQAASGKDTIANYLCEQLNEIYGGWYRVAFANNVKKIFCETFNVDIEFIEKWKRTDEIPPGFQMPVRKGLTFIGDGFRDIKNSIWIDLLLKENNKNLVLSDCRYINEADYIRSHNGITVLLWRPGHENNIQNRSEQELMKFVEVLKNTPDGIIDDISIPFDIWIKNDGTMEDLFCKTNDIILPEIREMYGY